MQAECLAAKWGERKDRGDKDRRPESHNEKLGVETRMETQWALDRKEQVEKKKRGKKRNEMKGMKAPRQRDELKLDSHHRSRFLFFSPLRSTYFQSWIKNDWLTTTNLSLILMSVKPAQRVWVHTTRRLNEVTAADVWWTGFKKVTQKRQRLQSPTLEVRAALCVVVTLAYVQLKEVPPLDLQVCQGWFNAFQHVWVFGL